MSSAKQMTSRPRLNWSTLWRVVQYLLAYKWRFGLILVLILLANIDTIVNSLYLQVFIDRYVTPLTETAQPDFTPLLLSIGTMAVIYLFGTIVSFLSEYLMIPLTQGTLRRIREEMFAKLQRLPLEYFDNNKFGDIMSRFTNDTDVLEQMIGRALPNALTSLTMIVMVVGTMFYESPALSFVSLSTIAVMLGVSSSLLGRSGWYFAAHQKALGETNAYIEEMINGQKVIKVFAHEKATLAEFAALNEQLAMNNERANCLANILMPVMLSFSNLQYALIGIIGGLMAYRGVGGVTLGLIASFLQLSRSLSRQFNQLSQQFNSVAVAVAGAGRIFDLIDELPEPDEGSITLVNVTPEGDAWCEVPQRTGHWAWKDVTSDGQICYTPLRGDVRFEHVSFAYEPGEEVLHDISFFVEPGEKVAFVGHTGAGKTTITNLLNRFYDIQAGQILYDGLDIKKIKKDDLRRSLGIILQDTSLFSATVHDNIAYGQLDATQAEIVAAAQTANAESFINDLPQKYETVLEDAGEDLSQGQRQLLAIARAAVSDPPVMIMDEATSSIDTRTERIIQAGMDNLMQKRTTLVIAHRLSTVRQARAIMVMDHGRIIESGSHEKLMNLRGVYYQLYTGAFELE